MGVARFFHDFKRYRRYMFYSTKASLKSEVSNSKLSWLWWVLDPLSFMLIYTFVAVVVFRNDAPYFPVFVFIGLTVWNFFSRALTGSVGMVRGRKGVIANVYLPKWALCIERMGNLFFKMCISWLLVLIMMFIWQVPFTWNLLYFPPLLAILLIITFGCSTVVLHFGVYMDDLSHLIEIFLRLLFYLSGIFYDIVNAVPVPYNQILVHANPGAFFIKQFRSITIYHMPPDIPCSLLWLAVGLVLSVIGVSLIYRYENNYAKVV